MSERAAASPIAPWYDADVFPVALASFFALALTTPAETPWYVPRDVRVQAGARLGLFRFIGPTENWSSDNPGVRNAVPLSGIATWGIAGTAWGLGALVQSAPATEPHCLQPICGFESLVAAPMLQYRAGDDRWSWDAGVYAGYERTIERIPAQYGYSPLTLSKGLGGGLILSADRLYDHFFVGPWFALEGARLNTDNVYTRDRNFKPLSTVGSVSAGLALGYRFEEVKAKPPLASVTHTDSVGIAQRTRSTTRPRFALALSTGFAMGGDWEQWESVSIRPSFRVTPHVESGLLYELANKRSEKCPDDGLNGNLEGQYLKIATCEEWDHRVGLWGGISNDARATEVRYGMEIGLGLYKRIGRGHGTLITNGIFGRDSLQQVAQTPAHFKRTENGNLGLLAFYFNTPVSSVWRLGAELRTWTEINSSISYDVSLAGLPERGPSYYAGLNLIAIYESPLQ